MQNNASFILSVATQEASVAEEDKQNNEKGRRSKRDK